MLSYDTRRGSNAFVDDFLPWNCRSYLKFNKIWVRIKRKLKTDNIPKVLLNSRWYKNHLKMYLASINSGCELDSSPRWISINDKS